MVASKPKHKLMEYVFYLFMITLIVSVIITTMGTGTREKGFGGVISDTQLVMRFIAITTIHCCCSLLVLCIYPIFHIMFRI